MRVNAEEILIRGLRTHLCQSLEEECVRRGLLFARIGAEDYPNAVSVDWTTEEIHDAGTGMLMKRVRDAGVYVATEASTSVPDGVGCRLCYDVVALGTRELAARWKLEPLEGPRPSSELVE
jgi:hypothetical protein